MPKITLIGAGSVVFTRNLCNDILLTPALRQSTVSLMDIDPGRLAQAHDEAVYHAVMLDSLTAAVCTLPQIRSMVDELLAAQSQWLPQF